MNQSNYINDEMLPKYFYLFSYGANNITQLSKTFHYNENLKPIITKFSKGIKIFGYKREFFGNSKRWFGAIATISPSSINEYVQGIMVFINKKGSSYFVNDKLINFSNILKREEFPETYVIKHVSNYNDIPILAFIKNPNYIPKENKSVSDQYLNAILKTISDANLLNNNKL